MDYIIEDNYKEQLIYVPEEVVKNGYNYYFNGNYIRIITNQNCTQNYNSTYCDCYDYEYKENVLSEGISCNTNTNLAKISNNKITTEIKYNKEIVKEFTNNKIMGLSILIVAILLLTFLTKERKSY